MLTIFSTPKPFRGHIGIIQRNAVASWKLLHPEVEVILFGADEGAAEICVELGLRYHPELDVREDGTKALGPLFSRAQQIARHDLMCYVNCDIILLQDFRRALELVRLWRERFLMVGRRWDTEIKTSIDFSNPGCQDELAQLAKQDGCQRLYYNIDYFAFRRGLYTAIPPLVIGRIHWDNWLVWNAASQKVPVVDASDAICAIHQNHDYGYHPQGQHGVWYDESARRNLEAAGGRRHLYTMEDATYRLTESGAFEPQHLYWLAPSKRAARTLMRAVRTSLRVRLWHPLMDTTRSLRHRLGFRRETLLYLLKPFRRQRAVRRHPFDC